MPCYVPCRQQTHVNSRLHCCDGRVKVRKVPTYIFTVHTYVLIFVCFSKFTVRTKQYVYSPRSRYRYRPRSWYVIPLQILVQQRTVSYPSLHTSSGCVVGVLAFAFRRTQGANYYRERSSRASCPTKRGMIKDRTIVETTGTRICITPNSRSSHALGVARSGE